MYQFRFSRAGVGEIRIDDFAESFECDLSFWSRGDYEAQWKSAEARVSAGLPALFFTSVSAPDTANFFRTWICYPGSDELVFREWIMFLDQLDAPVDFSEPHGHIPEYRPRSEDGEPISEWRTRR